jgi:hypothetical protein
MLLLLIATLLADWRYEGFASDPAQPELVNPDPSVPQPAPGKSRTIRVEAPSRPSFWHLADLSGQVWEDPDPDRLRHWVACRNASLTAARPRPFSRVRMVILSGRHFQ